MGQWFFFYSDQQQSENKQRVFRNSPIIGTDPLGKDIHLELYKINSLRFGEVEFENPQVIEIDPEHIFPCDEYKILGFIGANIIIFFSWSFDFDNNQLDIKDTDFFTEDIDAIYINYMIDETTYTHYMPISINGVDGLTFIDWGYTGAELRVLENFSYLFSEALKKYTIEGNSFKTVTGTHKVHKQFVLDNRYDLKLDSYEVNEQYRPAINLVSKSDTDVTLGNYFFRTNYNVMINSTKSQYVLMERKNEDSAGIPESVNYGITLSKLENGNFEIDGIIKKHPDVISSKAKPSMEILTIDGMKGSDFKNECELDEYISSAKKKNYSIEIY